MRHSYDEVILEALRGSVKKWELVSAGLSSENGCKDCPLCGLFLWDKDCIGCPICEFEGDTSHMWCEGTPYEEWVEHHDCFHFERSRRQQGFKIICPECRRIAHKELMFVQMIFEKWKEGERS